MVNLCVQRNQLWCWCSLCSCLWSLISKYKYTSLTGFDLLVKSSQETKQSRWGRSWVGSAHLTSWLLSVSFWKFELVRTSRLEFPGITLPEDRFAVTIYSFFHFYHVTFGVFHGESRFLGLRARARAYSVCACAHFSKKKRNPHSTPNIGRSRQNFLIPVSHRLHKSNFSILLRGARSPTTDSMQNGNSSSAAQNLSGRVE